MLLTTPVNIKAVPSVSYRSHILMLGSCFAQNIGELMQRAKLDVCINPFGVTYNPLSIAASLGRILDDKAYTVEELSCCADRWFSFAHHGSFDSSDRESVLAAINTSYSAAVVKMREATHVVVTFGSSYVYEYEGRVVNNCHKLPNKLFTERRLGVDEIVAVWAELLPRMYAVNPRLKVIFTVSPVRYMGNGAHESQLNKSTLLLAIDALCGRFDGVSYFPSYEIQLDELRDYRFYADDMIHPSPLAVQIIWQRFCDTYLTDDGRATMKEVEKIVKALSHRPLHPDTDAHRRFVAATRSAIEALLERYPHLSFDKQQYT